MSTPPELSSEQTVRRPTQRDRRVAGRAAFERLGPTAQAKTYERLIALFASASWTYAKSYHLTAPHWYSHRRTWASCTEFEWCVAQIEILSYPQRFNGGLWNILVLHDGYTYWCGWPPPKGTFWINRRPAWTERPSWVTTPLEGL